MVEIPMFDTGQKVVAIENSRRDWYKKGDVFTVRCQCSGADNDHFTTNEAAEHAFACKNFQMK